MIAENIKAARNLKRCSCYTSKKRGRGNIHIESRVSMNRLRLGGVVLGLVVSLWILGCGLSDEQDAEELRSSTPASSLTSPAPTSSANLTIDDGTDTLQPNVDRDCVDFPCQELAQEFFEAQGGPAQDPYQLDANRNGRACESLPACQSGGGGTPGTPITGVCNVNCSAFACQQDAQNFFISQGGPNQDPCDLDRDDDGQACDDLPPCTNRPTGG